MYELVILLFNVRQVVRALEQFVEVWFVWMQAFQQRKATCEQTWSDIDMLWRALEEFQKQKKKNQIVFSVYNNSPLSDV